MLPGLAVYKEVWAVDFEFSAPPGCRPEPVCLVGRELHCGRTIRLWQDELRAIDGPPYSVGPDSLFVAFYSSAEWGCHLSLGWPVPVRVLDLFAEFRNRTAGLSVPHGSGLLGALVYYGLPAMDGWEKDANRNLVLRGGPWSAAERAGLLDYCEQDVDAVARLLVKMLPDIDLPRALLRGRYMTAAAHMEATGVPVDVGMLDRLRRNWDVIRGRLVAEVDAEYGVYDGMSFRAERWERWLTARGIPWPRLPSGALALDDDNFRGMAKAFPAEVGPMRELRHTIGQMRLNEVAVGPDGRNRTLLSAFQSKTGRNQPSNSKFIFGPSCWLRSLIRPEPGTALAYLDWSGQEYGIAAALSGDDTMLADYASGDPYLAFARRARAVPPDATKQTHARERELFKVCCGLGAMDGAGPATLSNRLGVSVYQAREWLRMHRAIYKRYWEWSEAVVADALLTGKTATVFGWTVRLGPDANPRSLSNFPMQANGAEMLRLACCLATERGVRVCAPVHDALLVEAAAGEIEDVTALVGDLMGEAAEAVLDGFRLRTDAKVLRYPDRFTDGRGQKMWELVTGMLPA